MWHLKQKYKIRMRRMEKAGCQRNDDTESRIYLWVKSALYSSSNWRLTFLADNDDKSAPFRISADENKTKSLSKNHTQWSRQSINPLRTKQRELEHQLLWFSSPFMLARNFAAPIVAMLNDNAPYWPQWKLPDVFWQEAHVRRIFVWSICTRYSESTDLPWTMWIVPCNAEYK